MRAALWNSSVQRSGRLQCGGRMIERTHQAEAVAEECVDAGRVSGFAALFVAFPDELDHADGRQAAQHQHGTSVPEPYACRCVGHSGIGDGSEFLVGFLRDFVENEGSVTCKAEFQTAYAPGSGDESDRQPHGGFD